MGKEVENLIKCLENRDCSLYFLSCAKSKDFLYCKSFFQGCRFKIDKFGITISDYREKQESKIAFAGLIEEPKVQSNIISFRYDTLHIDIEF